MLETILEGDMEKILEYEHNTKIPIWQYNDENH